MFICFVVEAAFIEAYQKQLNTYKFFYLKVKWVGIQGEHPIYEVIETFPKYQPTQHPSIPNNIWNDYSEAIISYNAGAYKSTVCMCRRTLQNTCFEKRAIKKDADGHWIRLRDQIKQAFPGTESALIRELSDEIKYFGDYGAHPNDDGIDKVAPEEAKQILDFTQSLLEVAYVIPWKIKTTSKKITHSQK